MTQGGGFHGWGALAPPRGPIPGPSQPQSKSIPCCRVQLPDVCNSLKVSKTAPFFITGRAKASTEIGRAHV